MIALDLLGGDVRWESKFPDKVDLHAVEGAGKWFPKFDLSGHAPPVVDGDAIYFTIAGLHRFDLNTGKLAWAMPYDVTEGRVKRGNAPALVDGDVIYTSAKGQIRAHDKATGQIKWTSKDFGGAVAEMTSKGNVIYSRMGGHFYDYSKRMWVLEKPLGVAVSKQSGQPIWTYDKAQDGITNMLLVEGQNTLLISDSKNLIGLDTSAEGKIKENFKIPLEFKTQIGGGAKAARIGMKFARGGLLGAAKKDNDEDPPTALSLRENGTVVVRATQHMLAFDPKTHQIPWSVEYQAPGVAGWEKIVMGAITAAMYAYNTNQAAAHTEFGTGVNTQANNTKNAIMRDYQALYFKRFSATQSTGQHLFILTDIENGKDKGPGIVGVNMDTGAADHQVLFGTKEPDYKTDEITGRVFLLSKDSKAVSALALK